MDIKERIKPFIFVEYENNYSLILTELLYKYDVFKKRLKWRYTGNGFAMRCLAKTFIDKNLPLAKNLIKYDHESNMFCAYSNDRDILLEFATSFHDMCEDDDLIHKLFSTTKLKRKRK